MSKFKVDDFVLVPRRRGFTIGKIKSIENILGIESACIHVLCDGIDEVVHSLDTLILLDLEGLPTPDDLRGKKIELIIKCN